MRTTNCSLAALSASRRLIMVSRSAMSCTRPLGSPGFALGLLTFNFQLVCVAWTASVKLANTKAMTVNATTRILPTRFIGHPCMELELGAGAGKPTSRTTARRLLEFGFLERCGNLLSLGARNGIAPTCSLSIASGEKGCQRTETPSHGHATATGRPDLPAVTVVAAAQPTTREPRIPAVSCILYPARTRGKVPASPGYELPRLD